MTTYSQGVPSHYKRRQELLDGFESLVAASKNLTHTELTIQKPVIEAYMEAVFNDLKEYVKSDKDDAYRAMALDQIVTIRARMECDSNLKTCSEDLDYLVTALLQTFKGKDVSDVRPLAARKALTGSLSGQKNGCQRAKSDDRCRAKGSK